MELNKTKINQDIRIIPPGVKFNELKIEFNKLKDDHNTLANKWNTFCTAYVPGSPTVVGLPPTLTTSTVIANNSNIDNAKNDKIKTI